MKSRSAKLLRHTSRSETAAGNIAARIPHAKIIMNLRNPIDRAFSQYLHMLTEGVIGTSFREQIHANLRCQNKQFGPEWPLLEFGQYYEQVKRYMNVFPRSQIHISFHEDLERAPGPLMADLFAFLGVDESVAADMTHRHHEPRIPKLAGAAYLLKKWNP